MCLIASLRSRGGVSRLLDRTTAQLDARAVINNLMKPSTEEATSSHHQILAVPADIVKICPSF